MNARIRTSHPRRGTVAILAAFLMTFLVAMVAFAVDMGYLCVVQTQAQAVADAAAMAGANGLTNGMAISYAQSCAALNTANAKSVTLPASAVSLGTWNSTSGSFGVLTGSATSTANAIKVNVNLSTSNSNAVNLFFSNVLGLSSFNIAASAVASAKRLDVIIVQDASESYSADFSYAVTGHKTLLSDINSTSPSSYLGVVQHTGWGSTWASLQPVGSNFSSLNTTIGKMADCSASTTSAYNVYGGTATSTAVTTLIPSCSGSDLATGLQQAINMFNSAAYTSAVPAGPGKAIILSSDGESNATSNGQHPSPTWTDDELNTLAQTTAATALSQGISIYVVFYYHGSDTDADTTLLESLVKGNGTFTSTTDATDLPAALDNLFKGSMTANGVVQ